eukprot:CAMPEP_0119310176 /NCGR_PEP_ID=MMETSP1333-20130426/17944_1 /TAXON_ID=418940 /ORGANISM="Scyphosphaera apsteinii, Strain RCC1455" /LENGTH=215 /DNA_ID=CAMNT_0007314309 /DNA_START=18 /DNA_END=665 /DNA_ORIENTATION=+
MRLPGCVVPSQALAGAVAPLVQTSQRTLLAAALAGAVSSTTFQPALALGPKDMNIGLTVNGYAEVTCPVELAQGRAGGALGAGAGGAGIAQKCVQVTANVQNDSGKEVKDAGVFGLVSETTTGMSVLGNGQDGKNDAGQFAMIPKIVPGTSEVQFIFVSQQADDCVPSRKEKCPVQGTKPLVPLKFDKMKAIAYPGGDRYKLYDECEQNEFAEGC